MFLKVELPFGAWRKSHTNRYAFAVTTERNRTMSAIANKASRVVLSPFLFRWRGVGIIVVPSSAHRCVLRIAVSDREFPSVSNGLHFASFLIKKMKSSPHLSLSFFFALMLYRSSHFSPWLKINSFFNNIISAPHFLPKSLTFHCFFYFDGWKDRKHKIL